LAKGTHLPENVYAIDYVPHSWLFPRAACIVCHGGLGTNAEAFRSGVPMVAIPSGEDHYLFVRRDEALGWTQQVIPYPEVTAQRLSVAIADTLADSHYRTAATELSKRIRAEQGVATARALLEQLVRAAPRPVHHTLA
jgi:UDP:flavonoid glycosyltransferase YjiC (YdhE family)